MSGEGVSCLADVVLLLLVLMYGVPRTTNAA